MGVTILACTVCDRNAPSGAVILGPASSQKELEGCGIADPVELMKAPF